LTTKKETKSEHKSPVSSKAKVSE